MCFYVNKTSKFKGDDIASCKEKEPWLFFHWFPWKTVNFQLKANDKSRKFINTLNMWLLKFYFLEKLVTLYCHKVFLKLFFPQKFINDYYETVCLSHFWSQRMVNRITTAYVPVNTAPLVSGLASEYLLKFCCGFFCCLKWCLLVLSIVISYTTPPVEQDP